MDSFMPFSMLWHSFRQRPGLLLTFRFPPLSSLTVTRRSRCEMNSDDPDGWSFICGSGVIGPTATPGMGETTTTGGVRFSVVDCFLLILCFGTLALLLRVRLRGNSCLPLR